MSSYGTCSSSLKLTTIRLLQLNASLPYYACCTTALYTSLPLLASYITKCMTVYIYIAKYISNLHLPLLLFSRSLATDYPECTFRLCKRKRKALCTM